MARYITDRNIFYIFTLKFPPTLTRRGVHYNIQRLPLLVYTLSHFNSNQTISSLFLKINFNITSLCTPNSTKQTLQFRFPHQIPVRISYIPHTCYMTDPSEPPCLYQPNNNYCRSRRDNTSNRNSWRLYESIRRRNISRPWTKEKSTVDATTKTVAATKKLGRKKNRWTLNRTPN
jgi:hypothetical protein